LTKTFYEFEDVNCTLKISDEMADEDEGS